MKKRLLETNTQLSLFKEERLRRTDGKFCTKEQYMQDKLRDENTKLRVERDKYYRMYMAVVKDNERLMNEIRELKQKAKELCQTSTRVIS